MRRASHPTRPLDVAQVLAARRTRGLVTVWDVDGTLAPIAPTPEEARVPPATRQALRRLARRADTLVAVVSGRPLAQVERLVGGSNLWLSGLHGGARRAPGRPVRHFWGPHAARRVAGGTRASSGVGAMGASVPSTSHTVTRPCARRAASTRATSRGLVAGLARRIVQESY